MSQDESLQAIVDSIDVPPTQWEELASDLLADIVDGQHFRKKRHTILALAEAAYINVSQATVYRMPGCASKVAHYKWRDNDPAYEAAYQFLVGDAAMPGQARQLREQEIDEQEHLAISALAEAKNVLRMASADAAYTLTDALQAKTSHGPKWHERIQAANSILDRSDTETATKVAPAISVIDRAIMKVYHDDDDSMDTMPLQAGLPADEQELLQESDSQIASPNRHTGNHGSPDNDEDDMITSTPDKDSRAALIALRSYDAQNRDSD
jgi:hypothetical protein